MTGKFMITLRYLREIGACTEGRSAFEKAFPNGGEYQEVLDKCAEEGRMDFASWLLHRVGPTDDVRTYEDQINDENMSIFFAGTLILKKGAKVKCIKAGCGIKAGEGIKADCGIEAGWGIKAGCGIEAGDEYGIFAVPPYGVCQREEFPVVRSVARRRRHFAQLQRGSLYGQIPPVKRFGPARYCGPGY